MKKILCALLVLGIIFASTFTAFAATAGDVNSDGKINSGDALGILKYAVGISPKDFNKNVADMNKDKKVNSSDALIVLQISVGLIKPDIEPTTPKDGAETLGYFNTAINKVKTDAKSVNQKSVTNYLANPTTIPNSIQSVYKMLGGDEWLGEMLKENSQGSATYKGTDIKTHFPVEGESYASKLTPSDVKSAACTEKDGIYTITIVTVADAKSDSHQHGQGHNPKAFNIILPDDVNENIPPVAKDMIGTVSLAYPSSTIKVTVDSQTGNVLTAEYDFKWTIHFDKAGIILPCGTRSVYEINW
ncbi:MAG: hypothetical protein J6A67_06275 [Clostridia bacterium]|nr:hypothetical protein [Clostridia bacterium]